MYKKMSTLAGIAILMVVIAHAINHGLFALYAWTERYQHMLPANFDPYVDPFKTPQWFFLIFGKTFTVAAVPAFFAISGFFIAFAIDKQQENIRWETIKKRIGGLLSPFLIWTLLSILTQYIIKSTINPVDILFFLFGGTIGFWFIPAIVVFYFFSPLLIYLAKKNWKFLLLSTGILQVLLIFIKYIIFANINMPILNRLLFGNLETLFVYNVFFFLLGIVIGMRRMDFMDWLDRVRFPITIACIILLVVVSFITGITKVSVIPGNYWNNLLIQVVQRFYSLSFILVFLGFDDEKMLMASWLKKVGFRTFGIYLTHWIFQLIFVKAVYHFIPSLLHYQLLFTLMIILVSFFGPLLFMSIVRRSPIKSLYPYLFG